MTMTQLDRENLRPVLAAKQAYRRPELVEYGTLREITLTVGFSGAPDNPGGGTNCGIGPTGKMCKTHP
jgi:hypothetical protein